MLAIICTALLMSAPRDNTTAQGVHDWLRLYFQYRNHNVDVSEFEWTGAQIAASVAVLFTLPSRSMVI
ncbi:hypothetical protein DL764_009341 [Monosporascus ibericus]|uniref:Uncharacterized protein n=1 Tax=Monosporascus ibericus TaxID=155417 RepID=A0A4Q4SXI6_9PEZI|nr:hypothetical protein DL764_009341 [Monosporascus ibericus]